MTTIHAGQHKTLHFPVRRQDAVYKKGIGWLVKPTDIIPGLKVTDDKHTVNVDVHLPHQARNHINILSHGQGGKQKVETIPP